MENKKIILVIVLILLTLPLFIAEESFLFERNKVFTLELRMGEVNLSDCVTCSCDISIFYPNGSALVRKQQGTNVDGFCQFQNLSKVVGTHGGEMSFNNSADFGKSTFEITITSTGEKVGLPNIIIVIVFLFLSGLCFLLGYSFSVEKWILKTSFYLFSLLLGLLAVNSGRIIASESANLSTMSSIGLTVMVSIIAFMFMYLFIYWTIETFKILKDRRELRWDY